MECRVNCLPDYNNPRYVDIPFFCRLCDTPILVSRGVCGECEAMLSWIAQRPTPPIPSTRKAAATALRKAFLIRPYVPLDDDATVDAVWLASGGRLVWAQHSRLLRPRITPDGLVVTQQHDKSAFARTVANQGRYKHGQPSGIVPSHRA